MANPCMMVLQIAHSYRTEISKKSNIWSIEKKYWFDFERFVSSVWSGIIRRAYATCVNGQKMGFPPVEINALARPLTLLFSYYCCRCRAQVIICSVCPYWKKGETGQVLIECLQVFYNRVGESCIPALLCLFSKQRDIGSKWQFTGVLTEEGGFFCC